MAHTAAEPLGLCVVPHRRYVFHMSHSTKRDGGGGTDAALTVPPDKTTRHKVLKRVAILNRRPCHMRVFMTSDVERSFKRDRP